MTITFLFLLAMPPCLLQPILLAPEGGEFARVLGAAAWITELVSCPQGRLC